MESTGVSEDEETTKTEDKFDDSRTEATESDMVSVVDNISDNESKKEASDSDHGLLSFLILLICSKEKDKDSDASDVSEESTDDDADVEVLKEKLKKERLKGKETQVNDKNGRVFLMIRKN